jgi:hypothetical protein
VLLGAAAAEPVEGDQQGEEIGHRKDVESRQRQDARRADGYSRARPAQQREWQSAPKDEEPDGEPRLAPEAAENCPCGRLGQSNEDER